MKQHIEGGRSEGLTVEDIAKKHGISVFNLKEQIEAGIACESEHTDDESIAKKIAMDHLTENPFYYDFLEDMEKEMEEDYYSSPGEKESD